MAKHHDQDQAVIVANTQDQIFSNFINYVCVKPFFIHILIQVFEFELRSELNSLERHMHTKVWIPSESSLGAWRLEMSLVITVVF